MRIASIEINGFKSFARGELFDFHTGVTAIVGPNGCGKSNVVDAIKWVLGEQSRKDLRMKESTDVIFGGTQGRKAANHAVATIVFDNSAGLVEIQGAEFSVTRRLTRSGESSYLINGHDARLRDIKELFAGTGVGPDGYTIMEQGKIDALLRSNPTERRRVFEEAAGISTFRTQRASTEKKLEIVAANLERLTDKINEAKSRLRSIRGQASRALKFKELSERLRILRTNLALRQFHRLGQEREELLVAVADAGRAEGQVQKQLTAAAMELEAVAGRLSSGEEKLSGMREELHACELQLGEGQGRRNEARARVEGLTHSCQRLEADLARMNEQIEALATRRRELEASARQTRTTLEEAEAVLKALQADEAGIEQEGRALDGRIRGLRERHLEHIHAKNDIVNEKLSIEAESNAGAGRRTRLDRRAKELTDEGDGLESSREGMAARHRNGEERLAALKAEYEGAEKAIAGHNARLGDLRDKRHRAEMQLSACESRLSHLQEVERMLDGVEQGSRELMADDELRARFGVAGLVAEILRADIAIAPALEIALGELAGAVVVESAEHAFDAFDWLARRDGAAATLAVRDAFSKAPKAPAYPTGSGILGPLLDEVTVGDGFQVMAATLLNGWLLVADRDVARRLVASGKAAGLRLVTPTGETFSDGAVRVPSSDRSGGIITRRSELERLQGEHDRLAADAKRLAEELEAGVAEARTVNERAAELRGAIYEANVEALEARTELAHLEKRLTVLGREREAVTAELAELDEQGRHSAARLAEIAGELEAHDAGVRAIEAEIEGYGAERDGFEARRSELSERVTQARVRVAEIASDLRAIEQTAAELAATGEDFARRVQSDTADLSRGRAEIRRLEGEIDRINAAEGELQSKREELSVRVEALAAEIGEVQRTEATWRERERALNAELMGMKDRVSELKLKEEKLFLAQNTLREKLMDDYEVDLDIAYRSYQPDADQTPEREIQGEIEALQRNIKNLGAINMEAVEELEEIESRHEGLMKQERDLSKAKRALEDAIQRIEGEARRRFVSTFETVRGHFQRLFRKMFGGGSADIILLNPEDVLESGVEIMARPPGMEPKTLSLLSGGQRTMIAVALMFALFDTSSAPFALLDEVDAALDEANVERFCTVLKEYAGQSQFVIITHHKKTMGHADRLYGVTMQERGISKKVTVDLSRYEPEEALAA